jgi:NADH-quinone oxidoreductase subunit J
MTFLQFSLITCQMLTAIFILYSTNPMHAILFMILLFFETSITLALFNLEFFALLFLLVYVGAIAILFLFIVMLLEVRYDSLEFLLYFPLLVGLEIFAVYAIYGWLQPVFASQIVTEFWIFYDWLSDLQIFAQYLFNYYLIGVLMAGYILLVALIGAIALSYDYAAVTKRLYPFRRLSRSSNFLSFFQ